MPIKKTSSRVNVNDRKIINGVDSDVVQLHPMKHLFAWEAYLSGNANHWLPTEINMQQDVEQWKSSSILSKEERDAFEMVLGFFTTADSLAANNICMALYKHVTSPECRLYLLRQAYEEAIHTHAYQYIAETLGLDSAKIFNMYRERAVIYEKDSFILSFNEGLFDKNFSTGTLLSDQKFLENVIIFSLIFEGIFFYSSFAIMFSFQRQNKMVGSAEQIQYIMRDESQHLNFGINMTNTIKKEQPELWTQSFQDHIILLVKTGVDLEFQFAVNAFPDGLFGLTHENYRQYVQFIADRRLNSIHLPSVYNTKNPFLWMGESIDISKEKNFFETRVTEYQSGGTLDW